MTIGFGTGSDDEEGDAGGFFKEAALVPKVVFAQMPAVVGGEDDDRVVGQLQAVEGGENATDLGIDIADTGEITADSGAALLGSGGDVVAGDGGLRAGRGMSASSSAGCSGTMI